MIKIAIVSVDYNGHKDTEELLKSSQNLDTRGFEVLWLIVDNGSDTSVGMTVDKFPGVRWVQTGKNLGFAGGYNRGLKYAYEWGAEFILIINNDTVFLDSDLLTKLVSTLKEDRHRGLVSPKIYFAPEYEFYKERYEKKDLGRVIWYAGGSFDWNNIKSVHRGIDEIDLGKYDKIEKTGFISGACILVKREVFDKVGFFEEKLFAYFEDSDFVKRAEDAGFEQWYRGDTAIYHKVSRTSGIGSTQSDYLLTRNRMWFGMKWATARTKFALLRESIKFLLIGRPAQRRGVRDYLFGIWGWGNGKPGEKLKYPLDVSIVIVNFNTKSLTLAAIKSVYESQPKASFELIVVDNGSQEKFDKYPEFELIQNKKNLGFAKANNQGIKMARGETLLLLNSDTEVKKGAIDTMLEFSRKGTSIGAVSPKLLNPDGTTQASVFKLPTLVGAISEYFLGIKGEYGKYLPGVAAPVKVESAVMAAFMITQNALTRVGLLDERYFMYFEDMDYCRRIKEAGLSIYYLPEAEVIHHHGESGKNLAGPEDQWKRLIPSSKLYHGLINHYLINSILWLGQKLR